MNNKESAKVYYQKAVELAEKSKDKKLSAYQKDFKQVSGT